MNPQKRRKLDSEVLNENPDWSEYELLSEQAQLDRNVASNIVKLFDEGNTIPFIARYRRNLTGNLSPEELRGVREIYEGVEGLKTKIKSVIKTLSKNNQLDTNLRKSIKGCKTAEELELLYAPFKPNRKRSLADQAIELGLEKPALDLLNNSTSINLINYVDKGKKELSSIQNVQKGIQNIIASVIATNSDVLNFIREKKDCFGNFQLHSKKLKTCKVEDEISKYENYIDFHIPIKYIKPHQILAINRGEAKKVLSVKIEIPDHLQTSFKRFCSQIWIKENKYDNQRQAIISESIQDCYNRIIQPHIIREIRKELNQKAEKSSIEVFASNLKKLLLSSPVTGKSILGIDPGFHNGCKLALISPMGDLLDSTVIYPHKQAKKEESAYILSSLLIKHNCELIALGNGKACRETEEWLTQLISQKTFKTLDVKYVIVNEDGASIYSCSPEAKKEFPTLDPNQISAVSLARRLQNPLAELVKIEPQHLGIGMYQLDLKKKQLEETLNEVVSECVSFVGVDLNTASQCLLRKVAGLTDKRAMSIIKYRNDNGPFSNRKELKKVQGIGEKVFNQCCGFLRIGPVKLEDEEEFYKKKDATRLDCTYIHPESYDTAFKILKKLGLKETEIGKESFIRKFKSMPIDITELKKLCQSDEETIRLIVDALSRPLNYDLRAELCLTPLFKKELVSMHDLKVSCTLTGRVSNVTHFGCFVDIGVAQNGLIHSSKMNGLTLQLGDRVEVKVISLDLEKKRIGLSALKKI